MHTVKQETASTSSSRRAARRTNRAARQRLSKEAARATDLDSLIELYEDRLDMVGFAVENQLHAAGWVR